MKKWFIRHTNILSNVVSAVIALIGLVLPHPYHLYVVYTGVFALAGGLTNWLAVHMLFEKVPFLYGSGVVVRRFETFRTGIREMVMKQFFNEHQIHEAVEQYFQDTAHHKIINTVKNRLDLDSIFDGLVSAMMASSLGSIAKLMGGAKAFEGLRDPVKHHLFAIIDEHLVGLERAMPTPQETTKKLRHAITTLVDARLDTLTPDQVKDLMAQMIQEHLGALVIWGAVSGAVVGLPLAFIMPSL
jgi:hypothetical protein